MTGATDEQKLAISQLFFEVLDQYLKDNNLDRGVMLAQDVEETLLERGRLVGLRDGRANQDDDSDYDDEDGEEEVDGDHKRDSNTVYVPPPPSTADAVPDVPNVSTAVQTTVNRTSNVVIDNDSGHLNMYSDAVLKEYRMKEGSGNSAEDYHLFGSEGEDSLIKPTLDFSSTLTADVLLTRKTEFVSHFVDHAFYKYVGGRQKYVKAHWMTTTAWANFLFEAIGVGGWSTLKTLATECTKLVTGGADAAVEIRARNLARNEEIPALSEFFQTYAHVVGRDATKNTLHRFITALAEVDLFNKYQECIELARDPSTPFAQRVEKHERRKYPDGSHGRKTIDKVKTYMVDHLGIGANAFQTRVSAAMPISKVVAVADPGFLTLLDPKKFSRYVPDIREQPKH